MAVAIEKLNGATVGAGLKLTVEAATFSKKGEEGDEAGGAGGAENEEADGEAWGQGDEGQGYEGEGGEDGEGGGLTIDPNDLDEDGVPLFRPLPKECLSATHPTVVLRGVYAPLEAQAPRFLEELEAEILLDCLRFGPVVALLALPDQPYYLGAVVVTFETVASAQACGEVNQGRSFGDGFIQVQALGNWGEGEIVPAAKPSMAQAAEAAPGGGGGGGDGEAPLDPLADFFSEVEQIAPVSEEPC